MAEKNTLSILENIKKKMQKFEQKQPAKTELVSDDSGEFERIAPKAKPEESKKVEEKTAPAPMANMMFEDDLGMDDLGETVEVARLPDSAAKPKVSKIDSDISDLDLDEDEVKLDAVATVKTEEIKSVEAAPVAATHTDANQTQTATSAAAEADPTAPVSQPSNAEADLKNDPDFNFDDLEKEIDNSKQETVTHDAAAAREKLDIDNLDNISLDELLKDEAERKMKAKKSEDKIPEAVVEHEVEIVNTAAPEVSVDKPAENPLEFMPAPLPDLVEEKPVEAIAPEVAVAEIPVEVPTVVETVAKPEEQPVVLDPLPALSPLELKTEADPQLTSQKNYDDLSDINLDDLDTEDEKPAEDKSKAAPDEMKLAEVKVEEVKKEEIFQDIFSNSSEDVDINPSEQNIETSIPPLPDMEVINPVKVEENNAPVENISQQVSQSNISIMPSENRQEITPDQVKILHGETVHQTTQSIKKLMDASNTIASVKNLSKNNDILSELAIQLMEPKLEKWLNENLAPIVERIVQEEIKKIVPKE